jgi:cytochrome c553
LIRFTEIRLTKEFLAVSAVYMICLLAVGIVGSYAMFNATNATEKALQASQARADHTAACGLFTVASFARGGGGRFFAMHAPLAGRTVRGADQRCDCILAVISSPVRRGEVVFKTNCVLCHGVRGDGKGRAAALFSPPPADLTHSDKTDEYKRRIIRMGGAALHRSSAMPAWGERLTTHEIEDVVDYLRTINTPVNRWIFAASALVLRYF